MPQTSKKLVPFIIPSTKQYYLVGYTCYQNACYANQDPRPVVGNAVNIGQLHQALLNIGFNPEEWLVGIHLDERVMYLHPEKAEEVELLDCWLCKGGLLNCHDIGLKKNV